MIKYLRLVINIKAIRNCIINIDNYRTIAGEKPISNYDYKLFVRSEIEKIIHLF